jgi:hypothetical protein
MPDENATYLKFFLLYGKETAGARKSQSNDRDLKLFAICNAASFQVSSGLSMFMKGSELISFRRRDFAYAVISSRSLKLV